MTWLVLATDRISDRGLLPLLEDERFDVRLVEDSSADEFGATLAETHGLIVRSATKVDAAFLDSAPNLRVIGRAGVGVDNIDVSAASARGIAVFNAPGGNVIAAAELTMALILSLARMVPAADSSVRSGEWHRSKFLGVELRGRTLGLIGAGRIGREVAHRCVAFGMDVIAHDPYLSDSDAKTLEAELVELDELIETADVIALHVPLTDETRNLIDAGALRRMKEDALLINVSRGGVIVEEDLAVALEEGAISGAALDVYAEEPLPHGSPLRQAPNLVLTPHLGASTGEAQISVALEVALAIKRALVEEDTSSALNAIDLI